MYVELWLIGTKEVNDVEEVVEEEIEIINIHFNNEGNYQYSYDSRERWTHKSQRVWRRKCHGGRYG